MDLTFTVFFAYVGTESAGITENSNAATMITVKIFFNLFMFLIPSGCS